MFCTSWCWLEDCSIGLLETFQQICYRALYHVLVGRLATQISCILLNDKVTTRGSPVLGFICTNQGFVLRSAYEWKPMRAVQDWCYMLRFTGASHWSGCGVTLFSADVYLGGDAGEHFHNPVEVLPRHVPNSCQHLSLYNAWYDHNCEYDRSRHRMLHLPVSYRRLLFCRCEKTLLHHN